MTCKQCNTTNKRKTFGGYTPTHSRIFLAIDEWLGIFIGLALALLAIDSGRWEHWALFSAFMVPWAIAVYIISYKMQWKREKYFEEPSATD